MAIVKLVPERLFLGRAELHLAFLDWIVLRHMDASRVHSSVAIGECAETDDAGMGKVEGRTQWPTITRTALFCDFMLLGTGIKLKSCPE